MISGVMKSVLSRLPREVLGQERLPTWPELLARLDVVEQRELARTEAVPLCLALLLGCQETAVHVLWECETGGPSPALPMTDDLELRRADSAHPGIPAPHLSEQSPPRCEFELLPLDRGVYQMDGLLEARTRRNQDYWIVAVVKTRADEAAVFLRELVERHSRLLIVQRYPVTESSPAPTEPEWLDGQDFASLLPVFRESLRLGSSRLLRVRTRPDEPLVPTLLAAPESPAPPRESLRQEELRCLETAGRTTDILDLDRFPADTPGETTRRQQVILERAQGLIRGGCRPVLALDAWTLRKHFDQLVQDFCQPGHPVTLLLRQSPHPPDSTAVPTLGLLQLLPHTRVLAPRTAGELGNMFLHSGRATTPTVIWLPPELEPASEVETLHRDDDLELLRPGRDVALVACGSMVSSALAAADVLQSEGIDSAVIQLRCLQPLDTDRLTELSRQFAHWIVVEPSLSRPRGTLWSLLLQELGAARTTCRIWPLPAASPPSPAEIVGFTRATLAQQSPFHPAGLQYRGLNLDGVSNPERFGFSGHTVQADLNAIRQVQLPHSLRQAHARYEATGLARKSYLWEWCLYGAELIRLPGVLPELRDFVNETKVLAVILCAIYDDIADCNQNQEFLACLLRLIRHSQPPDWLAFPLHQQPVAELAWELWHEFRQRVLDFPAYEEYGELLWYDLDQFFNMMRYANLINRRLEWANLPEHDAYLPHNMMVMCFGTLDLMCSRPVPEGEKRFLRQFLFHAQQMARIANVLSTWARELREGDYSGALFIRALEEGDVTDSELRSLSPGQLLRQVDFPRHEQYLFHKWQFHRRWLDHLAERISSLPMADIARGHERFLALNLGSQGEI